MEPIIFNFGKRKYGTPVLEIYIDFHTWVIISGICIDKSFINIWFLCFTFTYYKKLKNGNS